MTLRVYNTLSRTKEPFVPVQAGKVGMYLCGPTVYKPPHIGHMVGPVIFDAIKRFLQFRGFEVTWVVNITDVDDKLIDAAAKAKMSMSTMAEKYTAAYMECLKMLGIDSIDRFPKASEHMAEIIAICQTLIASGHAYEAGGNVWFDVARDSDYGKLSNRTTAEQESGSRTLEGSGKRNPADFALWKKAKPGEPEWDSPWGKGRPGWHIECSAMSMKYLGETLDIHGGGMDLMFPHHENELAQSETATGKPFVKFWLHNGLTKVKTKAAGGEWQSVDMHASTGNVVSAKELIEKHGADLFRYMLLSTHYRSPIDFSDDVVTAAGKGLATFHRLAERMERLTGSKSAGTGLKPEDQGEFATAMLEAKARFLEKMDDDFNTGGAIGVLHDMAGLVNRFLDQNKASERDPAVKNAASAGWGTLMELMGILGLLRPGAAAEKSKTAGDVESLMKLLIGLRNEARAAKNFALSDAIRDRLAALGFTLEDRTEGTGWRKG